MELSVYKEGIDRVLGLPVCIDLYVAGGCHECLSLLNSIVHEFGDGITVRIMLYSAIAQEDSGSWVSITRREEEMIPWVGSMEKSH